MNADMLTRLVKMLTPDSMLGKLAAPLQPSGPIVPPGTHTAHHHTRAGITKNHSRGETKARRRMAQESRRRNRGK